MFRMEKLNAPFLSIVTVSHNYYALCYRLNILTYILNISYITFSISIRKIGSRKGEQKQIMRVGVKF